MFVSQKAEVKNLDRCINVFLVILDFMEPVDLVFMIDTSKFVNASVLEGMKKLILNQGRIFNISRGNVRIVIVSYGKQSEVSLTANNEVSLHYLKTVLDEIETGKDERYIRASLNDFRKFIEEGKLGLRSDAGKVLVLFISGGDIYENPKDLQGIQKFLKEKRFRTVVISIGNNFEREKIKALAPTPENVLSLVNHKALNDGTPKISEAVVNANTVDTKVDIGFIFGSMGGSKEADEFLLSKQIIKDLLTKLVLSRDKVRVGLIKYDRNAEIVKRLDNFFAFNRTAEAVDMVRISNVGQELSKAINLARSELFDIRNGGRAGIPKNIVLFVNKDIDTDSQKAANSLVKEGFKVIFVTLAKDIDLGSSETMAAVIKYEDNKDRNVTPKAVVAALKTGTIFVVALYVNQSSIIQPFLKLFPVLFIACIDLNAMEQVNKNPII